MSQVTSIEWATHSWNPTRGCSRISPGCENCYAEKIAARFSGPRQPFETFARKGFSLRTHNPVSYWTGHVHLIEDKLLEPLSWRKPRPRVFVNSMSDLFHEALPDEAIDRVFAVMALCPQSNFLILTKRAERMYEYFNEAGRRTEVTEAARILAFDCDTRPDYPPMPKSAWWENQNVRVRFSWPLCNVWLGVSVEDRKRKDRIEWLRKTPAAVRFVSYEPALGPVDFMPFLRRMIQHPSHMSAAALESGAEAELVGGIDWVITGGESGYNARPTHPDWFRSVRDQCAAAGVAFFMKQITERGRKIDFGSWPVDLRVREFPNAI